MGVVVSAKYDSSLTVAFFMRCAQYRVIYDRDISVVYNSEAAYHALQWRHDGLNSVSPASPLFTQPFIRAQIKENIKAPRHWPLCGEFTGDRWIPRTNGQLRGKCFHLMTSSCTKTSHERHRMGQWFSVHELSIMQRVHYMLIKKEWFAYLFSTKPASEITSISQNLIVVNDLDL